MFFLGCCFLFIGEITSYYSRMSKRLFTLSCKCIGTLLARCLLKIAFGLSVRCSSECFFFQHQNLMWHKP